MKLRVTANKIMVIIAFLALVILFYFICDFSQFANGVNEDTKRRNEIIKNKKGDDTYFNLNDTIGNASELVIDTKNGNAPELVIGTK